MMFGFKVVFAVVLMVAVSNCEPPVPSTGYGVPFNNGNNNNNFGQNNNNFGSNNNNFSNQGYQHHDHEGQDPDHSEPKSYEFGYAVKDDYSGNDYKRRETSDGNQVNGEYRVQLPDGRTQIVTYYADWQSGFHADVRYEGTASYPDQYAPGNNQGGNYQGGNYQGGNYQGGNYQGGNYQGGNYQGVNNYQPSNQYGVPGNQLSNQYGTPFNNGNTGNNNGYTNDATSSVTIKDYSGPGTPYNTNAGTNNGYSTSNQQYSQTDAFVSNNNYDSYANAGNFGSRTRPSTNYGAP